MDADIILTIAWILKNEPYILISGEIFKRWKKSNRQFFIKIISEWLNKPVYKLSKNTTTDNDELPYASKGGRSEIPFELYREKDQKRNLFEHEFLNPN